METTGKGQQTQNLELYRPYNRRPQSLELWCFRRAPAIARPACPQRKEHKLGKYHPPQKNQKLTVRIVIRVANQKGKRERNTMTGDKKTIPSVKPYGVIEKWIKLEPNGKKNSRI